MKKHLLATFAMLLVAPLVRGQGVSIPGKLPAGSSFALNAAIDGVAMEFAGGAPVASARVTLFTPLAHPEKPVENNLVI